MADKEGWISIHRQIQDCFIWDKKPFSWGQAWIDLLLIVNHADKKTCFDGKMIVVGRGQRIISIRQLCDRWGWSNRKVTRFLDILQSENMIVRKSDSRKTLITIVNYDNYQKDNKSKASQKHQQSDSDASVIHTNNNENNDNNIVSKETIYVPSPQEVVELYNSICVDLPFVKTITNARIKTIKTRLRDHSIDELKELFETAQGTPFLKGDNNRGWKAGFDWLMNEANMTKVLEGYYNKSTKRTETAEDKHQAWLDAWRNA
jgi:hypothetical protein